MFQPGNSGTPYGSESPLKATPCEFYLFIYLPQEQLPTSELNSSCMYCTVQAAGAHFHARELSYGPLLDRLQKVQVNGWSAVCVWARVSSQELCPQLGDISLQPLQGTQLHDDPLIECACPVVLW